MPKSKPSPRPTLLQKVQALERHLEERLDTLIQSLAQKFQALSHNQKVVSDCIEQLDLHRLTQEQVLREVFARFELLDVFLVSQAQRFEDLLPAEVEAVRQRSRTTFNNLIEAKWRLAQTERDAELMRQNEAAASAHAAQQEAERAETALRAAESTHALVAKSSGGLGAEIPAGAQVFGD